MTHPNITPTGLNQKELVDVLYQIVAAITGICQKLDADGGVTDANYNTLCYAAIINCRIEDSKGNTTGQYLAEKNFHTITPRGISDAALIELMYQIYDAWETMTEKLDDDGGVTDEDYEANCYTATMLHMVTNQQGSTLGNGNTYWFNPGGVTDQEELVEYLYEVLNSIETLTEQLDADGGVTDENYEALWYTATITTVIENKQGNQIGN